MRYILVALAFTPIWLTLQDARSEAATPPAADKYHVTNAERLACTEDAVRLCSASYPDEDALIICMKANRSQLSNACMAAFDAGLRKRHL